MEMLRALLGWTAATALLLMFPMVLPCMTLLRWGLKFFRSRRELLNSVVIITGASSGIGSCLAVDFAKHAKLVLAARREEKLKEVAQACLENGAVDAQVCPANITRDGDCRKVVDFALSHFGRVDVLVNYAGIAHSGLFEDYEDMEDFHRTMELDSLGTVTMARHALEHLKRSRGHLVVTGSVASYVSYPRQSMYNAAKGAVSQFYDTLRTEPVARSVDITVALPGFVESEMIQPKEAESHIPWWWPMLSPEAASRAIVEATVNRERHMIVPPWYATWLPYRALAPELVEWFPRVFLLGKPPNMLLDVICSCILGEQAKRWVFGSLARVATGIVQKTS